MALPNGKKVLWYVVSKNRFSFKDVSPDHLSLFIQFLSWHKSVQVIKKMVVFSFKTGVSLLNRFITGMLLLYH